MLRTTCTVLLWTTVSLLGAASFAVLALHHGETINAAWLLTAALCSYAVGYRFYCRILSRRIFALDDRRPTAAVRLEDGHDYLPTDRWVVTGHHFAAIAGAGPLVGPILAAQFGFLPGTLWIIVGAVLAGAVQDLVILIGSMRRDGRSLGQMARDEIGPIAGGLALGTVLVIVVILIAVLAFVVVNALFDSPWGTVSIGLTIPIALLMGLWMRVVRPGRVLEASLIGLVLLAGALWAGHAVNDSHLASMFRFTKVEIAEGVILYGFVAAVLPVWLLLAPRDYLSSFVKIGTVFLLAAGLLVVLPPLRMPALTSVLPAFSVSGALGGGNGPVLAGTLFPFAFITIACGAVSGFHALVSSGTTPKLIARESHAPLIGYGSMLMESFVAVMALIAACVLTPGVYFALNSPAGTIGSDPGVVASTISSWGFPVTTADLHAVAASIDEHSIISRAGGAPTLALGMAQIFARASNILGGGQATAFWYHFAIMFEALFILTTIDAGTRVARFILQDAVATLHPSLGQRAGQPLRWACSAVVVAGWAYFLLAGVTDPLGGIKMLWPLFGVANQLLAAIALCVGTILIVKEGKARWAWVTILPLVWLVVVTEIAGWQMVFGGNPRIGFLAKAHAVSLQLSTGHLPQGAASVVQAQRMVVNAWVDAVLCTLFLLVILITLAASARACWQALRRPHPDPVRDAAAMAAAGA